MKPRGRRSANLIYAVIPLTPLLFAGLLFAFGLKPRAFNIAVSLLIYVLACPVSIAILEMIQHRGGADSLHTIKSGVIIPFLVFGLGLMVTKKEEDRHPTAPCAETTAGVHK